MFEEARLAKFERGRREHGQPWTAEHVDAVKEMKDELLDLFNYSTLLDTKLGRDIGKTAKCLWEQLNELGGAGGY